ncbi:Crp/Fnr family transcriptional regulator [Chryseobacterium sp. SSA4.19]|uniref:Crp/Fnr family transcriptional regulator n=1 Tax=Chryseobacterium sp. SSA4.19 TaxID=2919915 RepID=UPI001F4E3AC7|nr:Crp/Fnr family transcriptional regulator [Chryseobacterium sp. SSA4.19]MCJ8153375.1 Crp/Fnr family transcriptional regulator [Chryseobacterium sp. SSA4.19]
MKVTSCMNIDSEFLYSYGAEDRHYKTGEIIYREGDHAVYYYQIVQGKIKQNNYDAEGREFIHNILRENQSFGESMIFLEDLHMMNAICLTPVDIIRLHKDSFLQLLEENPKISLQMNACLSQRLYFKSIMLQNMSSPNPALRLEGLLEYLKSYHDVNCNDSLHIELTRQQMANLTGLRVETVIRTLKKMETQSKIKIKNRKVYY